MTWAVVYGDDAWRDLDRLSDEQRRVVEDALISWVTSGPPADDARRVAGVTLFEHRLENVVSVVYLVDEPQLLLGVLRVRPV